MFSTDNNINRLTGRDPDFAILKDRLAIQRYVPTTRDEYDLIQTKDPGCVYIIKDAKPGETNIYFGDKAISKNEIKAEYLLGINDHDEYEIYEKFTDGYGQITDVVPISRFKDPQAAINALRSYKRVGSADKYALSVHNALTAYIHKECGIHECIVSLIAAKGYRDDPRLQLLNERAMSFGYHTDSRDIPTTFRRMLHIIAHSNDMCIYNWYSKLYDVFVFYEFFVDKKYTEPLPEELDLHEEIKRIIDCFE